MKRWPRRYATPPGATKTGASAWRYPESEIENSSKRRNFRVPKIAMRYNIFLQLTINKKLGMVIEEMLGNKYSNEVE
jgi:hypothetical protein